MTCCPKFTHIVQTMIKIFYKTNINYKMTVLTRYFFILSSEQCLTVTLHLMVSGNLAVVGKSTPNTVIPFSLFP